MIWRIPLSAQQEELRTRLKVADRANLDSQPEQSFRPLLNSVFIPNSNTLEFTIQRDGAVTAFLQIAEKTLFIRYETPI